MSRLPAWIGQHLAAVRAIIVMTIITGALYPLAMLGVAQAAFHNQANGSLVTVNGKVVGSSLLCQEFVDSKGNPLPQYFQPRPSTASSSTDKTDYGCDPLYSGASNLGPNNSTLVQNIQQRKVAYAKLNGVPLASVPPDAVTTSGSGLDPYISPQNAADQVNRVAAARHLPVSVVQAQVSKYTQGRVIGFLGEPRVNVLLLNIGLNALPGQHT
ncbi:potassium-transporting ATPase subunit KdpC [Trebonia kvetii]|uniref:Potassium-transporting ATPase KdpC subunit n=1 Tax=Trebonia kvetii TaxID=2480626 RepID=A0A6P2BYX7_9ACTN|nr:potassium-transporting ATPase subunit KdpC [Trebonia kvetii]TVZ04322.1 potassium-transporting ATPase subunit KdpC [Trebonia kvetii]